MADKKQFKPRSTEQIRTQLKSEQGAIELHVEAVDAGMPFGRYLERIDPSPENSPLDAYERQLQMLGIVVRSNPQEDYWASTGDVFRQTVEGRALFPEYFRRIWKGVQFATPNQRAAIMLSSDGVLGSVERPWVDRTAPQWNNQFVPAIPLSEIVGITSSLPGTDYRSVFMTYDAEALRMYRVGESAEIPVANLTTSTRVNNMHKYGRGLRMSYEALRRTSLDKVAWWIRWQALQAEVDKVSAALDILVNGDGNNGTAATEFNLLTLDPAANANELTLYGWLAFRMQWETPYQMTTALMRVEEALQLITLNAGTANIPLQGLNLGGIGNTLTPINATADGIRYGWTSEAPDGKIVGFDKRFALEMVTEIGSDITETQRYINNQTEVMYMTEVNGFGVIDPAATKILDLAE